MLDLIASHSGTVSYLNLYMLTRPRAQNFGITTTEGTFSPNCLLLVLYREYMTAGHMIKRLRSALTVSKLNLIFRTSRSADGYQSCLRN